MSLLAFVVLFLLGFGTILFFERKLFEKSLFLVFILAFGLGLSLFVLVGRLLF